MCGRKGLRTLNDVTSQFTAAGLGVEVGGCRVVVDGFSAVRLATAACDCADDTHPGKCEKASSVHIRLVGPRGFNVVRRVAS